MNPIVTTINSIEDVKGYKLIADIIVNEDDDVFLYIYDSNIIVISIISQEYNNRIFILTKVDDFYIKEKEIFLNDGGCSNKSKTNISITKYKDEYILALSDPDYKSEDGFTTGCVFLYKFLSGKGWCCVKEITSSIEDNKFGNYLEFTKDEVSCGLFK